MIIELDNAKVGLPLGLDPTKTNSTYDYNVTDWAKCRDAVAGQRAIKSKGETYLPKPNGHSPEQYEKYLQRARFFNATGRTLEGLMGSLFRKPPVVTIMDKDGNAEKINDKNTTRLITKAFGNLSSDGKGLNATIRAFTEEVIKVNRVGALVDFPYSQDDLYSLGIRNQADYDEALLYPHIAMYKAESIVHWDWVRTPTGIVPYLYVLKEAVGDFDGKTMVSNEVTQYRILYLENAEGPVSMRRYKQVVVKMNTNKGPGGKTTTLDEVTKIVYPKVDGKELNFIPFYILTDMGENFQEVSPSMLNDLVDVNLGHYQNSADWENELHWVGIKTAIFEGWDVATMGEPYIGTALAVPFGSKPYIMEASSDSGIKEEMAVKREEMAVLGAERLSQKGRYVASASTSKINSSSDSATLSTTATILSEEFSKILNFVLQWAGEDKRVNIQINTDFYQDDLDGEELLKWVEALQSGGISYDVYYYNLQKKECFPPQWDVEKEKEGLQATLSEGLGDGSFDSIVAELNMLKRKMGDLVGAEYQVHKTATTVKDPNDPTQSAAM